MLRDVWCVTRRAPFDRLKAGLIQQFFGFGHRIFSEVYAKIMVADCATIKAGVHPILTDYSLMPN